MAPVLSLSDQVRQVQEALVKLNLKVKELNEIFQSVASHAAMDELNGEIRAQLVRYRGLIADLRRLAQSQTDLEARSMLMEDVEHHEQSLMASQRQFKRANLACVQALARQAQGELLTPSSGPRLRRPSRPRDEFLADNSEVGDQLSAIARQLATTLERSAQTVEELAISSETVGQTRDEFQDMGSLIGQSRKLITKYGRRETTDRVLIFFAFAFFFACVFYILRKRVLGPLDPVSLGYASITTLVTTVMQLVGLQ